MPTFKSISKSNKPNNSIVNYAINDVNTVAIVTKDGEIIDKKDVLVMYADSKSHKQLIDEQKKRLYFKVYNEKNVLFYINSHVLLTRQKPDKTKLYFSVNAMFYDDCEEETKVPKPSIKSALSSLKDKGFINHYKDKEDKCVKGCYVANPKYIYSGTPEDYVNDCFELQTKGILVLI